MQVAGEQGFQQQSLLLEQVAPGEEHAKTREIKKKRPFIVKKNKYKKGSEQKMENNEEKCSICLSPKQLPLVFSPCKHSVCTGCYRGLFNNNAHLKCPECRADIVCLDSVPPNVAFIAPRLSLSEQKEAQQYLDEEYKKEVALYQWNMKLQFAKQCIPAATIFFGALCLVQAAQMGYFAMFCLILFAVSHLFDHQFRISPQGRNVLVIPRRRFANENIREVIYNSQMDEVELQ